MISSRAEVDDLVNNLLGTNTASSSNKSSSTNVVIDAEVVKPTSSQSVLPTPSQLESRGQLLKDKISRLTFEKVNTQIHALINCQYKQTHAHELPNVDTHASPNSLCFNDRLPLTLRRLWCMWKSVLNIPRCMRRRHRLTLWNQKILMEIHPWMALVTQLNPNLSRTVPGPGPFLTPKIHRKPKRPYTSQRIP